MSIPPITRESVLNINPSGMTPAWFDRSLNKAIQSGKVARRLGSGRYLVSSVTTPGLWYLTTLSECTCPGHRTWGRCGCRCLVAFEEFMYTFRPATSAGEPKPAA